MPPTPPKCAYAHLTTGPLSEDARVAVCAIPGVKFFRGQIWAPWHAIKAVDRLGLIYHAVSWAQAPQTPWTWEQVEEALRTGGEARPDVLEPGFLLDHQKGALLKGASLPGFHIHHATGAGKTLTAYLLALLTSGAVVFVTKSSARVQMSRELARFTTVQPYILRNTSSESPESIDRRVDELRQLRRGATDPAVFLDLTGATPRDEKRLRAAEREAKDTIHRLDRQLARALDRQKRIHAAFESTFDRYLERCAETESRPFVIVGWDTLASYLPLLRQLKPEIVVIDESHRGKSSKRWDRIPLGSMPDMDSDVEGYRSVIETQAAEAKSRGGFIAEDEGSRTMIVPKNNMSVAGGELARMASVRRRICTTATPVKNLLQDFWSQLDFAEPDAWGNADSFEKRYCNKHRDNNGFMDAKGISNPDELVERLRYVVHRVEYAETHKNLPPKRRISLYVAPEDQCAPSGDFVREIREAKARGANAVIEVKLAEAASKKRKVVCSYVEDHVRSGHKVVLFTARRRDCEELGKELRRVLGKDVQIWAAHGGQPDTLRQQIVDDYMDHTGPCVFVGTGDAFGESINLQRTDAAFFVMLPYTPGQLRQWEGRFFRQGQDRPCIVYYVIAEQTIDEHVAGILISKLPAIEKIVLDSELAAAGAVLGGIEDQEAIVASIIGKLTFYDDDDE